jgi:hypothetical protein
VGREAPGGVSNFDCFVQIIIIYLCDEPDEPRIERPYCLVGANVVKMEHQSLEYRHGSVGVTSYVRTLPLWRTVKHY